MVEVAHCAVRIRVAGLVFFMRVGAKKGSHTAYVEEGFPMLL
jgi:hypothetical protein